MVIKGFEKEDIEVSEFGEWVGNDYIDYKADYKEHKKIISALFKQRQELIDYLEQKINESKTSQKLYYSHKMIRFAEDESLKKRIYKEILFKMKKE